MSNSVLIDISDDELSEDEFSDFESDEEFEGEGENEDDNGSKFSSTRKLITGEDGKKQTRIPTRTLNRYIEYFVQLELEYKKKRAGETSNIKSLKMKKKHVESLFIMRDSLKRELNEFDDKIREVHENLGMTSHQLKITLDNNTKNEQEIEKFTKSVSLLNRDIDEMSIKVGEKLDPLIKEFERNNVQTLQEIEELKKEIITKRTKEMFMEDRIKKFEKEIKDFNEQLESQKKKFEEKRTILYQKKNRFLAVSTAKKDYEQDFGEISQIMTHYDEKVESFEEREKKMLDRLNQIEKALEQKESTRDTLKSHINAILRTDKQESDYNKQLSMMENLLNQSLVESRSKVDLLHERIRNSIKKNREVKRTVFDKENKAKQQENAIYMVSKNLQSIVQKKQLLEQQITELQTSKTSNQANIDTSLYSYLQKEKKLHEHEKSIQKITKDNNELEFKLQHFRREEQSRQKDCENYSRNLNKKFQQLNSLKAVFIGLMSDVKHIKFQNTQLQKELRIEKEKNQESIKVYEVIKLERNDMAREINANTHSFMQIQKNLNILENERKMFMRKVMKREGELMKCRSINNSIIEKNDKLKCAIGTKKFQINQCSGLINDCENQIKQMNSVISQFESDMNEIRESMKENLNNRNMIGNRLIDKNDEVILLNEKLGSQKQIIVEGNAKLATLTSQIKSLESDLSEIMKKVERKMEKVPHIEAAKREKSNLLQTIQMTQKFLSTVKQVPEYIPPPKKEKQMMKFENLQEQIKRLESLLAEKSEAIYEKKIILKELSLNTVKLKQFLESRKTSNFNLSNETNTLHVDIQKKNREIQSLLAELSIYQANSMTQRIKNEKLAKYVTKLSELDDPPLEIQKEIEEYLMKKQMQKRQNFFSTKDGGDIVDELNFSKSTALVRPNSYVEQESQLPRPYGQFKPFVMTQKGANSRHYQNYKDKKRKKMMELII